MIHAALYPVGAQLGEVRSVVDGLRDQITALEKKLADLHAPQQERGERVEEATDKSGGTLDVPDPGIV
jgi:phage shock protein A